MIHTSTSNTALLWVDSGLTHYLEYRTVSVSDTDHSFLFMLFLSFCVFIPLSCNVVSRTKLLLAQTVLCDLCWLLQLTNPRVYLCSVMQVLCNICFNLNMLARSSIPPDTKQNQTCLLYTSRCV